MPFDQLEEDQSQPIDWNEFHPTSPYYTYPANPTAKKVVASVWNRALLRRSVERIASHALTFATVVTARRITSKSES